MFGAPLPSLDKMLSRSSGGKKASENVPDEWKPMVSSLQNAQAANRMYPLQGYVVGALSGEKFNSENWTLNVAVPIGTWHNLVEKFFTGYPGIDTVADKEAPFKVGVQPFNGEFVQMSFKVHSSILQEVFPQGVADKSMEAVQMIMSFFVYNSSSSIKVPGVSFKVGYLNKA